MSSFPKGKKRGGKGSEGRLIPCETTLFWTQITFQALFRHFFRPGGIRKPSHVPLLCLSSHGLPCLLTEPRYVLRMGWEVVRAWRAQRRPRVGAGPGALWSWSSALQRFPRPPRKKEPTSRDLLRLGSKNTGTLNMILRWRLGQRKASGVRSEWPLSGVAPGEASGAQGGDGCCGARLLSGGQREQLWLSPEATSICQFCQRSEICLWPWLAEWCVYLVMR